MISRVVFLGQSSLIFDWLTTRPRVEIVAAFIPPLSSSNQGHWLTRCVAAGVPVTLEATPEHVQAAMPQGVDLGICAHFQPLPREVICSPRLGVINIHPAPLPEFPGRYPLIDMVLSGVREGGVSLHWMSERIDQGDLIAVEHFPSAPLDGPVELEVKAEHLACRLLQELWTSIIDGYAPRFPQEQQPLRRASRSIPCPLVASSGEELLRMVKAYGPYGGVGLYDEERHAIVRLTHIDLISLSQDQRARAGEARVNSSIVAERGRSARWLSLENTSENQVFIPEPPLPLYRDSEASERWGILISKTHMHWSPFDLSPRDTRSVDVPQPVALGIASLQTLPPEWTLSLP